MLQARAPARRISRERRAAPGRRSKRCRSTTAARRARLMALVLHHVPSRRALAEAARVLKPGGRVLIVDMLPHDREEYRSRWATSGSGSPRSRCGSCSEGRLRGRPDPRAAGRSRRAKGPALFAAVATRPSERPKSEGLRNTWIEAQRLAKGEQTMATMTTVNEPFTRSTPQESGPRAVQGRRPRSPSGAARRSAWPSTRCPA